MVVVMSTTRHTLGLLSLVVLTAGSLSLSAQRGQGQGQGQGRGQGQEQRYAPAYGLMGGTYDLETTRGGNVQRTADQATRNLPPGQRERAYQSLLGRLDPPRTLSIHRQGQTVTISSSNGPRTTFDADGRTRNESGPGGRGMFTRATLVGDRLSVMTSGNRSTDFLVTFEPLNRGDGLLVTRRFDSDELRQPVTIQSYYRRVASEPRWDLYTQQSGDYPPRFGGPRPFTVPDGTRMVAVLDTSLSTRTSRNGERFTMTVESPLEYRDARIDGVVARITPYGQGHNADMRIDFDTIRLRNGQTAEFDAILNTVRAPGGQVYRVDASGGVPEPSHTNATITQGAIGAALGAIIGAVAGGGKGAAIGAVVGGAGGAILAQDRDQYLELPPGTEVTIIVTSRYRTP
jgi:hypothetical protein